ncbi:cellulase family glycosylhydrolase [Patescibacteria group bacterium]|nr:cellulase family glycosylhydrolase [Patescibacteria group bacterium]
MNSGITYDDNRDRHKVRLPLVIFLGFVIFGSICAGLYLISDSDAISSIPSEFAESASVATITESTSSNPFSLLSTLVTKTITNVSHSISPTLNPNLNYNYGVAMGDLLPGLSATDLNTTLNDLASLHVGWIRLDMAWNDIQPVNSTTYNWTNMDRVVAAANAHQIQLLPILDYTPKWARSSACAGTPKCQPADPTAFATFAKVAATRYAPQGIVAWEIWNEPNSNGFWKPSPDPAAYTTLLKYTYTAIKSVEPSSIIISGGLSPAITKGGRISPMDFLKGMYANGAKGYFDAFGFHPYTYPVLPTYYQSWNAWSQMSQTNPSLQSIMVTNGDSDKKIWFTEFGSPTGGPGKVATSATNPESGADHVTESVQAQILQSAIQQHKTYTWAGPFFLYSYKDQGTSSDTVENFFGLLRFDGTPKPSYSLFSQLIAP